MVHASPETQNAEVAWAEVVSCPEVVARSALAKTTALTLSSASVGSGLGAHVEGRMATGDGLVETGCIQPAACAVAFE